MVRGVRDRQGTARSQFYRLLPRRPTRSLGVNMTKDADPAVDQHVGYRLRMRRKMLGLTQEALGEALALTFQQVQKYENGKNRISAGRLQQLSQILKVPIAFFFEGAPGGADTTAATPSYVNQFFASSDGLALAKAFMRIENRTLRRLLVELIEDCAELSNDAKT
jgi:transcriptional regulator with XRE-family HTH domain